MIKISARFPDNTDAPLLEALIPFAKNTHLNATKAKHYYFGHHDACFDLWNQTAKDHIRITSPEEADLMLIPINWYWVRRYNWRSRQNKSLRAILQAHCDTLKPYNKPILLLFSGDRSCEPVPLEDVYVARESIYASRTSHYDIALPAICDDLFHSPYAQHATPEPSTIPSLSFCGLARSLRAKDPLLNLVYLAQQRLRFGFWDVSPYKGEWLRSRLLNDLSRSNALDTHFTVRHKNLFIGNPNQAERDLLRKDFVENMESADYTLCTRGSGNFSFRFYETLCMGKTPVLVDTDTLLPFEEEIDWRDHILRVPEEKSGELASILAEHHNKRSQEDLEKRSKVNRQLWLDYFTPDSYLPRLFNEVIKRHKKRR